MNTKITHPVNRLTIILGILFVLVGTFISVSTLSPSITSASSIACTPNDNTFLGLVPWYEYLKGDFQEVSGTNYCGFHTSFNEVCVNNSQGQPELIKITSSSSYQCTAQDVANQKVVGVSSAGLDVIWGIGLAIFEDLLRIAGMVAVFFVIYGGVRYLTSQGSPEATKGAWETILNALIGLGIVIIAAASVSFIANRLG